MRKRATLKLKNETTNNVARQFLAGMHVAISDVFESFRLNMHIKCNKEDRSQRLNGRGYDCATVWAATDRVVSRHHATRKTTDENDLYNLDVLYPAELISGRVASESRGLIGQTLSFLFFALKS